jgi:hypothetical protein
MRVQFYVSFVLYLVTPFKYLFSQVNQGNDSIQITIIISKQVKVNDDLKAKIIIKNISKRTVNIYKDLVEGDIVNEFGNLLLKVEKKDSNKFIKYSRGSFFDPAPVSDTIDRAERIQIHPNDSLINFCHLDNVYQFEIGYYRLKCLYRNDVKKTKRVQSNWVYFRVINKIYVKHYFD